jgi:glutathione S-transferase
MKLYTSIGPNPRVVHIFLAEKGVEIPRVQMDLMKGENRQEAHLKRNPAGQSPSLETDSGQLISEITAICEYIEEKNPNPVLIGSTPEERANTRMWARRIDLNIIEPMTNGFRYGEGLQLFKDRIPTAPEASAGLKAVAQNRITWLDGMIGDGRQFIAGNKISLADILFFGFIDFGATVGQAVNRDNKNVSAWYDRMKERPSVKANP